MIYTETRAINETLWGLRNRIPLILQQGGSSCFAPGTLVVTPTGNKPIEEIKVGDVVLSYNEKTRENEERVVIRVLNFENTKRTIRVRLKNGQTITATEDHKFYHKGGWHTLKHLLSLKAEKYGVSEAHIKDIVTRRRNTWHIV